MADIRQDAFHKRIHDLTRLIPHAPYVSICVARALNGLKDEDATGATMWLRFGAEENHTSNSLA